jgi:hypothetical protein
MVGNFRGKSEKALKINFRDFKFRDSKPVQGRGAAQTIMYSIRALDLAQYLSHFCKKLGQIA